MPECERHRVEDCDDCYVDAAFEKSPTAYNDHIDLAEDLAAGHADLIRDGVNVNLGPGTGYHPSDAEPRRRLRAVCKRLLAAYAAEESEHGFPFNLELRAAHRELAALISHEGTQDG